MCPQQMSLELASAVNPVDAGLNDFIVVKSTQRRNKCKFCKNPLRSFSKGPRCRYPDWAMREYHKRCWNDLSQMIVLGFDCSKYF